MIYMLRTCNADGISSHGFKYPTTVGDTVECPDWDENPNRECGGGLHGLPNGIGEASLIPQGDDAWWQVYEVAESDSAPLIGGKARWRRGRLVYSRQSEAGSTAARDDAIEFLLLAGCPRVGIVWDRVASGYSGQSTSGDSGQSTSGDRGQSTSGDSGQSTAGDRGQCAAGAYGGILITWLDAQKAIFRVKAGEIGVGDGSDGLLKAGVFYSVDSKGNWVEGKPVSYPTTEMQI